MCWIDYRIQLSASVNELLHVSFLSLEQVNEASLVVANAFRADDDLSLRRNSERCCLDPLN